MAIPELTTVHYSGNRISASKHTTQTLTISRIITTVNSHTDINFSHHDQSIEDELWHRWSEFSIKRNSSDSIFTSGCDGSGDGGMFESDVILTELQIIQTITGISTTSTITDFELYENGSGTYIIDCDMWLDAGHYFITHTTDNNYWYKFPLGLYRLGCSVSHTLTLRIINSQDLSLHITDIKLYGYNAPS